MNTLDLYIMARDEYEASLSVAVDKKKTFCDANISNLENGILA